MEPLQNFTRNKNMDVTDREMHLCPNAVNKLAVGVDPFDKGNHALNLCVIAVKAKKSLDQNASENETP